MLCNNGLPAFAIGAVTGFIDEMLGHLLSGHPTALKWIRRFICGASIAVGVYVNLHGRINTDYLAVLFWYCCWAMPMVLL